MVGGFGGFAPFLIQGENDVICCFINLREKENVKDLKAHFDKEIEHAIDFGCSTFVSGINAFEDKLFCERVMEIAKYYQESEICHIGIDKSDDELKELFIAISDWEIYSYECQNYLIFTKTLYKSISLW